jgi:hypothetical protein
MPPKINQELSIYEKWKDLARTRQEIQGRIGQDSIQGLEGALSDLTAKTEGYELLRAEQEAQMRVLLGRNFLGTQEWKRGLQVEVGRPLPIPEYITAELLDSECLLHPGSKVKETHVLLLMPTLVDGKPYSGLRLSELCRGRRGSGARVIDDSSDDATQWKGQEWAQESPERMEWILIPTSDPTPRNSLAFERKFRGKKFVDQIELYKAHYQQAYREAKPLELITATTLHYLVNGEPRMLASSWLRCTEPHSLKGFVEVGRFIDFGLRITVDDAGLGAFDTVGLALVRRPSRSS